MRQRISRIYIDRPLVKILGLFEFVQVIVNRAQIHQRAGCVGVQLNCFFVRFDRLYRRRPRFLQRRAAATVTIIGVSDPRLPMPRAPSASHGEDLGDHERASHCRDHTGRSDR